MGGATVHPLDALLRAGSASLLPSWSRAGKRDGGRSGVRCARPTSARSHIDVVGERSHQLQDALAAMVQRTSLCRPYAAARTYSSAGSGFGPAPSGTIPCRRRGLVDPAVVRLEPDSPLRPAALNTCKLPVSLRLEQDTVDRTSTELARALLRVPREAGKSKTKNKYVIPKAPLLYLHEQRI